MSDFSDFDFDDDDDFGDDKPSDADAADDAVDADETPAGDEELFLGMTAFQRLVIALMLLMNTCVLGTLCMVATGTFYVVLPF